MLAWALERRQFGPPGGDEALLMDYRTHQRRLLPALAKTYALSFAQQRLVDQLHEAFTTDAGDRDRRQDHVLEATRAWVDLVVLESFPCDPVVETLRSLYALHTIEAERGCYQEHGRLSASRSKAVIKAVNELCGELRPDARALVDAFGVPENVLVVPEPVTA